MSVPLQMLVALCAPWSHLAQPAQSMRTCMMHLNCVNFLGSLDLHVVGQDFLFQSSCIVGNTYAGEK